MVIILKKILVFEVRGDGFVALLLMKGQLYKQPIENLVFFAINLIKIKNSNLLFVLINLILFKIAKALKFLNFS
ncbi:MAG: hypothetical protein LBU56_01775 [Rickettsiales bacterium]|jgi:hypothetical protein|nr:hypothetical protein [Rickettsiales bacterium]